MDTRGLEPAQRELLSLQHMERSKNWKEVGKTERDPANLLLLSFLRSALNQAGGESNADTLASDLRLLPAIAGILRGATVTGYLAQVLGLH